MILQINVTFSLKIKHSERLKSLHNLRGLRLFATFEEGPIFLQAKIKNPPAPKDLFLTPPLLGLANLLLLQTGSSKADGHSIISMGWMQQAEFAFRARCVYNVEHVQACRPIYRLSSLDIYSEELLMKSASLSSSSDQFLQSRYNKAFTHNIKCNWFQIAMEYWLRHAQLQGFQLLSKQYPLHTIFAQYRAYFYQPLIYLHTNVNNVILYSNWKTNK
jgi:hypothetical protein